MGVKICGNFRSNVELDGPTLDSWAIPNRRFIHKVFGPTLTFFSFFAAHNRQSIGQQLVNQNCSNFRPPSLVTNLNKNISPNFWTSQTFSAN
jgi:hypothetical protein